MEVDRVLTFNPLSIGLVSGYLHESKRIRQHVISYVLCTCVHMINVCISCMHIERG